MTNAKSTLTENAVEHWRELARIERAALRPSLASRHRAELYDRTAEAIELTRETGIGHCACHLISYAACKALKR